ncbi:hypothetical protein D9757_005072 [Collybiopsis confluens]|uniref:F-box domain-containing protein n=1 Tax=Collybiopsis confluens TaxID=2823264 RepID=A0A8H5HTG5_9AGAR|nr:hypothetical protein D9757_005072 [Collybiopsis confluens]
MSRRSLRISEKGSTSSTSPLLTPPQAEGAKGNQPLKGEETSQTASRKRSRPKRDDSSKQSLEKPLKKKQKTKMPKEFRHVRGKHGLLERLARDVPLDVMFEIFSYFDSNDLLNLSRTTRNLRSILLDRSSEFAWRRARNNWGNLPPIPEYLSEPGYADLLFGTHCHICGRKGGCEPPFWSFRLRCCRSCAIKTFPQFATLKRKQPEFYRSENIFPRETLPALYRGYEKVAPARYIGHEVMTERLRDEFETLETDEEQVVWIVAKRQEREALLEHANQCNVWYSKMIRNRDNNLRKQRREAYVRSAICCLAGFELDSNDARIFKRLEGLGHREEIDIMIKSWSASRSLLRHESVDQAKVLTEQAWKRMKGDLIRLILHHKEARLENLKKEVIIKRCLLLETVYKRTLMSADHRSPLPGVGDILNEPSIHNMIINTPAEDELSEAFYQSQLKESLPKFIEKWAPLDKVQQVLHVLQKAKPSATASDLHLASSTFICTKCSTVMVFPEMFHHRCCFEWQPNQQNPPNPLWVYTPKLVLGPWHCPVKFDAEGSEFVKSIIEACGLDPMTATTQDMFAADPLVECLDCQWGTPNPLRLFMHWPAPFRHRHIYHLHKNYRFVLNKSVKDRQTIRDSGGPYEHIRCVHCNAQLFQESTSVLKHLKESHQIILDQEQDEGEGERQRQQQDLKSLQEHWYWNPSVKDSKYHHNVDQRRYPSLK